MQAQTIKQWERTISLYQNGQQAWESYARELEKNVAQLKGTMDLQTKAIRTLATENQEQARRLKRREISHE
jgi:hypothetical protein